MSNTLDNSKRLPLVYSLTSFTEKQIDNAEQLRGKFLPCSIVAINQPTSGDSIPIVTVKFEVATDYTLPQVTIAVIGSEYIRYPLRVGDKGICIAADTHIGNMTGLGAATSTLTQPGNLAALIFVPVGNVNFSAWESDCVVLYSLTTGAFITISPTLITLQSGSCQITLNSSGTMNIKDGSHSTSPTVMHNNFQALISWLNSHTHTSGSSGSPTSAPISAFSGSNIAP